MLKVIELFSGIDSQRETLKRENIEHEVVVISDNDKYAAKPMSCFMKRQTSRRHKNN